MNWINLIELVVHLKVNTNYQSKILSIKLNNNKLFLGILKKKSCL